MTQYYSRIDATLNGDVYNIPFSYMKESEISVYINDEPITAWEFLNESQIKINEMPSEITADAIVSIRRTTDITKKVVDYTNQSMLSKESLNLSQDQLLNAVQEIYDNNITWKGTATDLIETNKQDILAIQSAFEDQVNSTIAEVNEAAGRLNQLEESVEIAAIAADSAKKEAEKAANSADNATYYAEISSIEAQKALKRVGLPIGSIFQAIRTDVPVNSLRADGTEYSSGFGNFVSNFLATGKILCKSFDEWQTEYTMTGGNVGFFAYDADTGKFKAPCIQTGTFLAQAVASGEFGSFLNSEIKSHNHIQDSHAHTRGTMEITGNMYGAALAADGAFYTTGEYGAGSGDYNPQNIGFQASRTWTGATSAAQPHIYPTGGDDTYPKHIKYPFFVVVSNVEAESPSQVVWDNFVGNLDNKANTDLSNINSTAKETISRFGVPSDRFDTLAIGATGTRYTAPANGYFHFFVVPLSNGYSQAWLHNLSNNFYDWAGTDQIRVMTAALFVKKGDVVIFEYGLAGGLDSSFSFFRFYYAEGVK